MENKVINLTTSRQPERMLSKDRRTEVENLITEFCGAFCAEVETEDTCRSCTLQRFSDWLVPKAFVLRSVGKRLWIPDGTRMRFTYPDGSVFTYVVDVIDVTHVELSRIDGNADNWNRTMDWKYGQVVLHTAQFEAMVSDPNAEVEVLADRGWMPLEEAINGNR